MLRFKECGKLIVVVILAKRTLNYREVAVKEPTILLIKITIHDNLYPYFTLINIK
jgi:hypothetical protein